MKAFLKSLISVFGKDQSEPQMFVREADRQRVTSDMRAAAPVQTHRPSFRIRIKTIGMLPESYSNILSKIRQKGSWGDSHQRVELMKMQKCQTLKGKIKCLNRLCIPFFVLPQFQKRNTDKLIDILPKKTNRTAANNIGGYATKTTLMCRYFVM